MEVELTHGWLMAVGEGDSTPDIVSTMPVFKTGAINHSATTNLPKGAPMRPLQSVKAR
jgi:hypothetical protein